MCLSGACHSAILLVVVLLWPMLTYIYIYIYIYIYMYIYVYIYIYARIEFMHLIKYYKTTSMHIRMVLELEIQLIAYGSNDLGRERPIRQLADACSR